MFEEKLSSANLSAEDLELLARVRTSRREQQLPEGVQQRVLARVTGEARREARGVSLRAIRFVPVARWARSGPWLALAAVLGAWLVFGLGGVASPPPAATAFGPEPPARDRARSGGGASAPPFEAPRFGATARALPAGHVEPPAENLFRGHPFAERSRAFQLRRWDDLTRDPGAAVEHDFIPGGLCFPLGAGERVLGGWPWARAGEEPPERVPLARGTAYRLSFKVWAREPLPAELLIGVGHATLPFSASAGARVPLSAEPRAFEVGFVAEEDDPSIGVAFVASGADAAERTSVCVSDLSLTARAPR